MTPASTSQVDLRECDLVAPQECSRSKGRSSLRAPIRMHLPWGDLPRTAPPHAAPAFVSFAAFHTLKLLHLTAGLFMELIRCLADFPLLGWNRISVRSGVLSPSRLYIRHPARRKEPGTQRHKGRPTQRQRQRAETETEGRDRGRGQSRTAEVPTQRQRRRKRGETKEPPPGWHRNGQMEREGGGQEREGI